MKKFFLAVSTIALFTFVSCKNDDDSGSGNGGGGNLTTQQKIIGVWHGDSITFNIYANGILVDSLSESISLTAMSLTFANSGDVIIDSAGVASDTVEWSVIDNHHINFDDEVWHIDVLNNTNFNFSQDTTFLDTASSINFTVENTVYTTK